MRTLATSGPRGLQITNIEDLQRMCGLVIASGLAPKSFDTPAKVAIAIQRGAEIGLSPMQSLDSFYVTNGKVTIWGDAIPALVRASGTCKEIKETVSGDGDQRTAVCRGIRSDTGEEAECSFSVADAKRAGLWGKSGPWSQYPDRMLKMRARSWLARDLWADVLRGLAIKEEVEDYEPRQREVRTVNLLEEFGDENQREAGNCG